MAIELVTGHAGEGHVSSADTGRFNAGVCGSSKYVLRTGLQFAYSIESNNLIQIASGDAVDQGRHIIIPQNTMEDALIQNGTLGKTRIDIIALRYEKNAATVDDEVVIVESAELVVVKGTEVNTGSTPVPPALESGDIFNGASADEMPLYHVLITDTTITSVTKVFKVIEPLSSIADSIYPVGSIYMNVNDVDPAVLFGGTWEQIQGKFLLGASSDHAAGSNGGAETVNLSAAQLPAHTHSMPAHTHSVPDHTHTVPAHGHTATTASAGGHRHKQIRQKNAASGTARYALQGTDSTVTAQTETAGAHTHTVNVANKPAFNTTESGSCTTGSTSGTSGSTGSGAPVSIMPPFLAVHIWLRTS